MKLFINVCYSGLECLLFDISYFFAIFFLIFFLTLTAYFCFNQDDTNTISRTLFLINKIFLQN